MPADPANATTAQQDQARAWFETLQGRLIAAFEALEQRGPGWPEAGAEPGRFERRAWDRTDHDGSPGGGGTMAMLKGRVFEKAGIHASTVFGRFAPEFASAIPGAAEDPRFWASGVSLIAHPWNPRVPAVHMNTRFVVTTRAWFGGGADLTPVLMSQRDQTHPDAQAFHAAMAAACAAHEAVAPYPKFKQWCDDYFFLKHRGEPRGIGGLFYDYLSADQFDAHFAFTRAVGEALLGVYPAIAAPHLEEAATPAEVEEQLVRRGRYVEFNLLYDRGTIFGLKTGGNVESILSSLPPRVHWPRREALAWSRSPPPWYSPAACLVGGLQLGGTGVAFNKGDIVQLKAGGPAMIVTGQRGDDVDVLWYGEISDDIKKGSVPDFCLVEAEIEEADDEPLVS